MNKLEEAAKDYQYNVLIGYLGEDISKNEIQYAFENGARWQAKQSPWISIEDRSVKMPNDRVCLLRLEDGSIVRDTEDTEDWEGRELIVTHWMPIPSFDEILEDNKGVLKRIKEQGD